MMPENSDSKRLQKGLRFSYLALVLGLTQIAHIEIDMQEAL
jgi:hypothetical protein